MKCIQIQDSFGIDNLKLNEIDEPNLLAPHDVKVKILASSLNYRDLMMIQGLYNPKQPLPLIPCSDAVGIVTEIGSQVDLFKPGDRVCSLMNPLWQAGKPDHRKLRQTLGGPLSGMLREYAVMSQDSWVRAPENLTDEEAATLSCAALTAWSALVTQGQIQPGETVLVQGTGGVSLFALLFAKAAGAYVIATSSCDEKLKIATQLGADATINYHKNPHWGKTARELTDKRGVDHIIEVGGAETLTQSLNAVAVGGKIHVIGVLTGVQQNLSVIPLLMQNVRMQGIFVGNRDSFIAMNRLIELANIHPYLDSTYLLPDTPDAFRKLQSAKHVGKIVVQIGVS